MRKDRAKQVFSAILNVVTWQANLVCLQDSSTIKCYRHRIQSCSQQQKNIIMLLELDLRMLLYFFSENYQVHCQNNV